MSAAVPAVQTSARSLFVGVDPGKSGAIAVLDTGGGIYSIDVMPVVVGEDGGRVEDHLPAIARTLAGLAGIGPLFVTVEKTQPLPPMRPQKGGWSRLVGGSVANFARGVGRGWEWMLVALGIPYELVAPQTWQKAMLAGVAGD